MTTNLELAQRFKDEGNALYRKQKFNAALDCYTEAICFAPTLTALYTNRALCHSKLLNWDSVISDCLVALSQDKSNVKGNYLLGLAYTHQQSWESAVEYLKLACRHGGRQSASASFLDEINVAYRRAMKRKWEAEQKIKIASLTEMTSVVFTLLKEREDKLLVEAEGQPDMSDKERLENEQRIKEERLQYEGMVKRALERETYQPEVPDHLCCAITMDIMRDPVITPGGVSYERAWIEKHLQDNGQHDPISRKALTPSMLIPNLALRKAAESFLDEHPWAFECEV